jgi:hypothetical protein
MLKEKILLVVIFSYILAEDEKGRAASLAHEFQTLCALLLTV